MSSDRYRERSRVQGFRRGRGENDVHTRGAEPQSDGEPYESSRSDLAGGSVRWSDSGPGEPPSFSGREGREYGSYDGYDRPPQRRSSGGGYGEYNYRDEDSPQGRPMGRVPGRQDSFGGGLPTYGRPGDAMRGQFTGKGPKGYQRSDDRIREDVSDALERNGELDASEIEVQVQAGEVTLEGTVPDRSSKRLAEDLIEDLSGVKHVHNRLRVAGAGASKADEARSQSDLGRSTPGRSSSSY